MDLGILLDKSQQYALAAKKTDGILNCIKQHMANKSNDDTFLLLRIGEETPGVLCQVLGAQYKKEMAILEGVQWSVMKGLEYLSYEEDFREQGLLSVENRKLSRWIL